MSPARLKVQTGDLQGRVFELPESQVVTLGRHLSNTISLPDELVSRWHALVACERGRWLIANIGNPGNGTRIDGDWLPHQVHLRNGQEITVGNTTLRFVVDGTVAELPPAAEDGSGPTTPLQLNELSELCDFMGRSVEASDPQLLVRLALDAVHRVTRATLTGFLSLDADDPLPQVVWPEQGQVDFHLSQQLNQRAQQIGKTVWIAGGTFEAPSSESLSSFSDALCVPLWSVQRQKMGALQAYRRTGMFYERHRRFCEIVGGHLASILQLLRTRRTLEAENVRLRGRLANNEELVGASAPMQRLRELIARAAPRKSTVLVRGETGVGKELVALALHRQSPRGDGPLVVVNCATIAAGIPEAELFGHAKGAFTGADRNRPGLVQQAHEGTLFLDEVGELPLDTQALLLRVVEGHPFRPVGASAEVRVDVRLIAATNRDLERAVKRGAFRQDLLYRLQVITLSVPPLREHADDIPALVNHFLAQLAREHQRPFTATAEAVAKLQSHPWPGNVRQLWAVLESAAALSDGPKLDVGDLAIPGDLAGAGGPPLNLEEMETWAIREALRQTNGNVSKAARVLGIARDTLGNKIKRKGIDRLDP